MTQKRIFINNNTQEVAELLVVKPAVYQFYLFQVTAETLASSGWFMSDTDPGYRGKPKSAR